LLKFDWGCWNSNDSNFIKVLKVHLDVSKYIRIAMEIFYIAQLWIWLFEVTNSLMKLLVLQIAKCDLPDGFYPNVSNLYKCF